MTLDDCRKLFSEAGIKCFFREAGNHTVRIFCSESDRFVIEETVWRFFPVNIWCEIITEWHDYRHYNLPTFTLRDHLKDCFGWLCCGVRT